MQGRLWLPLGRTATISPVADTVTYIICMTLRSSSAANWFGSCSWREGWGRRGRARQGKAGRGGGSHVQHIVQWAVPVPRDRLRSTLIRAKSLGSSLAIRPAVTCDL